MKNPPPKALRASLAAVLLFTAVAGATPAFADTIFVRDVKLSSQADGTAEVFIAATGTPSFTARVTEGGLRLLIDINGADVKGAPGAIIEGNAIVAGVMTQAYKQGAATTTRVLIQLTKQAEYRVIPEPSGLRVLLVKAEKTGPMSAARAPKAPSAQELAAIADVRFEHKSYGDRVVIELAGKAEHTVTPRGPGKIAVELKGVSLATALQRKLDTAAFGGPIRTIATYRRNSDATSVVVEIDGAEKITPKVDREGSALVVTYATGPIPSMISGIGLDGGAARKARTIAREEEYAKGIPKVETRFDAAAGAVEQMLMQDQAGFLPTFAGQQQQRRFTGNRIDLDLKEAPIHEVLRLIADVGKVNIVTSDAVTGAVTIKLRNVPWDQALETVLQAKGLGMVRQGNMIRVAPLADLNKERELAIARRKAELQLAPIETRIIPVNYAEAKELQERAKDMLSPRGSIAVDERTNVLIVRDVAGNLSQIEELVRTLDTQTPQVLIEARIVEATSRYLRDVGVQWGGDATFSPATGNPTGIAFPSSIGIVGGASDQQTPTAGLSPFTNQVTNPNFAVNLPATVGTGQGGALGLSFGSINNTVNIALRLSAAEQNGVLRIVSSPRILTLDNQQARISQGTLIPFSQISAQGVQTTFQEAKLQLLVKPHVTSDGSVAMHVRINRDEPDFNQTSARGDPTILKREAETDLLIMDGHTAVIGGIFTRNTGRNLDQVPLLGDIPILGLLFQRRRASDTRTELVIFLTPRIVNRAEALGK